MKLNFPYTFVTASGLHPAQFSYTGTMIRTVDSYSVVKSCDARPNTTSANIPVKTSSGKKSTLFKYAWPQKNPAVLLLQACLQSLTPVY